jgi:POT family proton-dependent oligopeptide transporter
MWLCMSQLFSNLISQAAQMNTHGLPNEIVPFFNAAACMVLVPVVQYTLGKLPPKYRPGPIMRISIGFVLSGLGFAYTAGLQSLIFHTGPCYNLPRECPASAHGTIPNNISFFLQFPVHVAVALGEILSIVTGLEYAYEMAPADMKAMVQAAYSLGSGLGSLAGLAFSPLARNPQLVLLYSLLAVIMMCSAMGVWCYLRKYNSDSKVA